MDLKKDLELFIHLFNELVAHVIPGALLISSFSYIFFDSLDQLTKTHWLITTGLSYMAGHVLLGLNRLIETSIDKSKKELTDSDIINEFKKYIILYSKTSNSTESINLSDKLCNLDYRNIAMSISTEGGVLGRRFMFISLFCKGTSTCIAIIYLMFITKLLHTGNICTAEAFTHLLGGLIIAAIIVFILENRASEFNKMSMSSPFSVATIEAIARLKKEEKT